MTYREFKFLVRSDLYRCYGRVGFDLLIRELILGLGFKLGFWLRLSTYTAGKRLFLPLYVIARVMLRRYIIKFGIGLSHRTSIGPGLLVGHIGGIVVSASARIGKNCNLSQDVTIGIGGRGDRRGVPVIGDNVYIGPGAKIFGPIRIGNGVAVGANCVVTKDVPDNAVVVGVPARIISYQGSADYISNTDYEIVT